MRAICKADDMPAASTVCRWVIENVEGFTEHYTRARKLQAELLADELMEIADDGSNDWMQKTGADGETGGFALNGEHVQRSRLRVDTRKWYLSKVLPKVYGDKVHQEISGPNGGPIPVSRVELVALVGENGAKSE